MEDIMLKLCHLSAVSTGYITCVILLALHYLRYITCVALPALYYLRYITCVILHALYYVTCAIRSSTP